MPWDEDENEVVIFALRDSQPKTPEYKVALPLMVSDTKN
jgi:hypothetical protein